MFNLINVRPYVGIMKHCLLASVALFFSSCNDVEKITDVIEEVTGYGLKIGNSALYLSQNQIIFDTPGLAPDFYDDRTFSVTNTTETELFFGPMTPSTADFTVLSTTCEEGRAFIGNATCDITVRYSPLTTGEKTGTLLINYGVDPTNNAEYQVVAELTGLSDPAAPANFTIADISSNSVRLTWTDQSSFEDSFLLETCKGLACNVSFSASSVQLVGKDIEFANLAGLDEGEYYQFRISAIFGDKSSDKVISQLGFTFGGATALVPGSDADLSTLNFNCLETENTYLRLTWNPSPNIYTIRIYEKNGVNLSYVREISDAASGEYVFKGLPANTSKSYILKAVTTAGFESQNTLVSAVTTSSFAPCVVLGQDSFDRIKRDEFLQNPYSVSYDPITGKLAVADTSNNRVLIWNTLPTSDSFGYLSPPDVVVGKKTMEFLDTVTSNEKRLSNPYGVDIYNNKMVIADSSHNRVLVYNTIPTSNYPSADVVIGQLSFTARSKNITNSNTPGQNTLHNPRYVEIDSNGKLYISDFNNERILVFNSIPTTNGANADSVIGQSNFTSQGAARSATRISNPYAISHSGSRLYLADYNNRRALAFDEPYSNGMAASAVIGQDNFTTNANNTCNASSGYFRNPLSVKASGGKLYVGSNNCDRIMVFDESDLTTAVEQTQTASIKYGSPSAIEVIANDLWVTDTDVDRIQVMDNFVNLVSSSTIKGIFGGTAYNVDYSGFSTAPQRGNNVSFSNVRGIDSDGTRLVVADRSHARILIWNTMPSSNNQPPDIVLGQPDLFSMDLIAYNTHPGNIGVDPDGDGVFDRTEYQHDMRHVGLPEDVKIYGDKLIISDDYRNRVLIWNSWPTSNGQPADIFLGQGATYNADDSYYALRNPKGIEVYNDKLIVVDDEHDRIAIWNTFPDRNNQQIDVALGHPDVNSSHIGSLRNVRPPNAGSFYSAQDVAVDSSGRLYVSDSGNHRILVYDTIPSASGTSADHVIGQADFTSYGVLGSSGNIYNSQHLYSPVRLGIHDDYIYTFNSRRAQGFDTTNLQTYMSAERWWGQDDLTRNDQGTRAPSLERLRVPYGMAFSGDRVIYYERERNRIIIAPVNDLIQGP